MKTNNAVEITTNVVNGVNVDQIMDVIGAIEADPGYAKFQWRATNQWIDGGQSQSRVKEFSEGAE